MFCATRDLLGFRPGRNFYTSAQSLYLLRANFDKEVAILLGHAAWWSNCSFRDEGGHDVACLAGSSDSSIVG